MKLSYALDEIRKIYDRLPTIDCKGLCWNSCGPIDMSRAERSHLTDLGADIQTFTSERAERWAANEKGDLYCSALSMGARGMGRPGCTVYQDRPLICRLWGMTDAMRCDHGCEPSRRLSEKEAFALVFEVMRLGGHAELTNAVEADFMSMLDDPEAGAVFERYLAGDVDARSEALALIENWRR